MYVVPVVSSTYDDIALICLHAAAAVCVFFTLNRDFYPSTYSTTSVRADSSILEEIQALWSTKLRHRVTKFPRMQPKAQQWAMQSHASSYWILVAKGTTCTLYKIEKRKETNKTNKNKEDESEEKKRKKNKKKWKKQTVVLPSSSFGLPCPWGGPRKPARTCSGLATVTRPSSFGLGRAGTLCGLASGLPVLRTAWGGGDVFSS